MTDGPTTTRPPSFVPLSDDVRAFLDDTRFSTLSTIDPDGSPRQAVVWYTFDADELVFNSAIGRRWPANLLRDPRIAVAIHDDADGYRWVGLTGTVEPVTDQPTAQADIAGMARRYHADEPGKAETLIQNRFQRQERISFRFRPQTVHDHRD